MKRNILLIEPGYKAKYPPIGLMKISTYHKNIGDKVTFFKGEVKEHISDLITENAIKKIKSLDPDIIWEIYRKDINSYIKKRASNLLEKLPISSSKEPVLIPLHLSSFANYYKNETYKKEPFYDRVYISTLFTFHWDITIRTIQQAKDLVRDTKDIIVGGILATLLKEELISETGIVPITGLLDKPGILDKNNKCIIDDLPLDYSLLNEIDYKYSTGSAYFTFMTKGCTRKCPFCSVPKLEPKYKPHIETKNKFKSIKKQFGEQRNLLLMDNNVLASPNFEDIIKEIKDMGFYKGAKFKEPNQLDISVRNLKKWN